MTKAESFLINPGNVQGGKRHPICKKIKITLEIFECHCGFEIFFKN